MKTGLRLAFVLLCVTASSALGQPWRSGGKPVATYTIKVGGSALQVDFTAGDFDLPRQDIVNRIQKAAFAVSTYYGRFPVPRARVLVLPVGGESGVVQGTTWGDMDGFPGFTRLRIGQHTTKADLAADWTITHELVHMAFASMPDDLSWLEEGIATYVEPIARVQAGELTAEKVWGDMMAGMPNGEPEVGDGGLNANHSWGRTYWGGALFCLVADIEIRKQTKNRKGLQDALKAIVAAGGTIDKEWPIEKLLRIGDSATGTKVLEEMYASWSVAPKSVDLDKLWGELGVLRSGSHISFNPVAPMSRIRVMLTAPQESTVSKPASIPAAVPGGIAGH